MKIFYATFTVICVLAISPACFIQSKPDIYLPGGASENWLTYTNTENGFHIKFPDTMRGLSQDADSVNFSSNDDTAHLNIQRVNEPMDAIFKRRRKEPDSFRVDSRIIKINGLDAKKASYWVGNFGGSWEEDSLYVQNGLSTYIITWTPGQRREKAPVDWSAIIREMISTFGIDEVKHADRIKYIDPYYHFSFEYPTEWRLGRGGFPEVVLNDPTLERYRIWVFIRENTTLQENQKMTERWPEYQSSFEEIKPYFAHQIIGQKYMSEGKENYAFQKGGNLYIISIQEMKGPRKVVDDILDSLSL